MTTRASFSQHWWSRILVFVAIAGPVSQPWLAEASHKFLSEYSGPGVFPGKATWGTSKDVSGPISFSVGTPKRRGRSVLVGARPNSQDEEEAIHGAVFRGEGQVRWEGRALPLVNEEEGMVVSASISIAGGEPDMKNNQGDQVHNGPRLLPPSPQSRPQTVTPYPFNWWWKRRRPPFASGQLNKEREEMDGRLKILQAGLMGDSPFVYTRHLRRSSTNESPRSGRVYIIQKEAAPQDMEDQNTKTQEQYGSSNDNKQPERTKGVTVQQDHVVLPEEDLPQVSSRQEKNNVAEEIEKGLLTSSAQRIVSVEKRHAENNDILSDYAALVTAETSQETQGLQEAPDVTSQSETATPEDQGVKIVIYVNPSEEGKFLVYFEEEERTNSSLSSTSFSSHETQQMNLVDQSSSRRYSSTPSSPNRPRYIIVKEDPLDHLAGGSNMVDSRDGGRRYRVQVDPGVNTERDPSSTSRVATELFNPNENLSSTNMTGSEEGKAHAKPNLKPLATERGSRIHLNGTTFYPTPITVSVSPPTDYYDSQEVIPETPESGINEIEDIALSEHNRRDGEETTLMSVEPRTPIPSQANGKNQEAFNPDEEKDFHVGHPRALRLLEESQLSGSIRAAPHTVVLLPLMLLVSVPVC